MSYTYKTKLQVVYVLIDYFQRYALLTQDLVENISWMQSRSNAMDDARVNLRRKYLDAGSYRSMSRLRTCFGLENVRYVAKKTEM